MMKLSYPGNPKEYYLVYEIKPSDAIELKNKKFRYRNLAKYQQTVLTGNRRKTAGRSFVVTLEELINVQFQSED